MVVTRARSTVRSPRTSSRVRDAVWHQSFGDALPVLTAYRDFLLGRASPENWKRCAVMRSLKNSADSFLHRFNGKSGGQIDARRLASEIRNGRVALYRQGFKLAAMLSLYRDIAGWLPALKREARS